MLAALAGSEAADSNSELASLAPAGRFARHAVGGVATYEGAVDCRLETEIDGIVGPQVQAHGGTRIASIGAEVTGVDGFLQCGKPHRSKTITILPTANNGANETNNPIISQGRQR